MKSTRRNHDSAFKAQVAFAAFKGSNTLAEPATQLVMDPTQIADGKPPWPARAVVVFGRTRSTSDAPDRKVRHAKIGQLALACNFFIGFKRLACLAAWASQTITTVRWRLGEMAGRVIRMAGSE